MVCNFIFTGSFLYFYFIKKLLHSYFGCYDLLLFFLGVGLSLPLSQDVKQNLEKFSIKFVYGDMKSEPLAACRAPKWSRMKKKLTQRNPPAEEYHQLKAHRGNYQSYLLNIYKNEENIPYPIGHGWYLTNGESVFSSESPFFKNSLICVSL